MVLYRIGGKDKSFSRAPVGAFLVLANVMAKSEPSRVNLLALAFVASRFGFASRCLPVPSSLKFPIGSLLWREEERETAFCCFLVAKRKGMRMIVLGFSSMIVTYLSTLGMAGVLLLK